jgi:undecaprenyl-diphosphatase
MTSVVAHLLALPAWLALVVIFALPALEASVFLGFLIPGETALVLGGVLAGTHALPLLAVLALGILGAIVGDSVGYYVGRRWGRRVLDSTLGRFIKAERIERGQAYLAARGGRAVLLGRFTATLRALVPGLAGMSGVPYRTFLPFNVAGGVLWGSGAVLLGYLAGASWRAALHAASGASLGVLGVVLLLVLGGMVVRRVRERRARARQGSRTGLRGHVAGRMRATSRSI